MIKLLDIRSIYKQKMIKRRNILISTYGLLIVLIYLALGISGGILESPEILFYREISFIISPQAPRSEISVLLFQLFALSLLLFALSLSTRIKNVYAFWGGISLSLSAITGLALIYFPPDPEGMGLTYAGLSHVAVAMMMALNAVYAIILFAKAFTKMRNLTWMSTYSGVSAVLIFYTGSLTMFFAVAGLSKHVGFFQKIPIGLFLLWILVTALAMFNSDHRVRWLKALKPHRGD